MPDNRLNIAADFQELKLDRLSRRFGTQYALRELTLTIKRGEFIALLGPSGCGKTTALNCLAGLLTLTDGSIWLDQRRIDVLRPEERGFGMVFQNYALFPHMSVRKNIAFGLMMRKLPKAEIHERVERAIKLVQLQAHTEKLPGQLSGGQQQRVAIARAIVIEPPLILMDEPLSNLDAKLRLEMRAEIRAIHRALGRATVYVTHDQEEALSLADRVVVMKDGVVRQVGTPEELYHRPANLDVANFMGFQNAIDCETRSGGGDAVTVRAGTMTLTGTARERLGARGIAVFRPEDIMPVTGGANAIAAEIISIDYGGREFLLKAKTADGVILHARSEHRVTPGERITLGIEPTRLLVFAADAPQLRAAAE
jgi:putative spermidine/putrescine transport system ATP-binding protein